VFFAVATPLADWRPPTWMGHAPMAEAYADTLTRVAGGRAATVARLRTLATRLEQLPLEDAVDALLLLEPVLAKLVLQADRALERAPRNTAVSPRA
jgi:hypothetical protein